MSVVATLGSPVDFAAWRQEARALLMQGVAPEDVLWRVEDDETAATARASSAQGRFDLLGDPHPAPFCRNGRPCDSPSRSAALRPALSARGAAGGRAPVAGARDGPDVAHLAAMIKSVSRDRHKMTAFVRFREREGEGPRYVAWFEPEHLIEEHVAPFFVDRYASMEFVIFTPRRAILWSEGGWCSAPAAGRSSRPMRMGFPRRGRPIIARFSIPAG